MPVSYGDGEAHASQSASVSRLLCAAKHQLLGTGFGGWITITLDEVDALEHDALDVLSMIRSAKNAFALVNQVPPDVLTLIPDYWEDSDRDQNLIKLTHVCRGWREIFTTRSSLWTRLDCMNIDKTRIYIERSRPLPLTVHLNGDESTDHWEEAFFQVVPHIGRLKTLSVSAFSMEDSPLLSAFFKHFSSRLPLLDKLTIQIFGEHPSLPGELFDGDLSSLRELCLGGVLTSLPWKDMSRLTTFQLCDIPKDKIIMTQLLDFFESAPRIRRIHLHNSIPGSSNAPAERVVSLPHLENLKIIAQPAHSILLNHLSIPVGASLNLEFSFSGKESPIPSYLPKSSDGLLNLSSISAVNLCFGPSRRFLRLNGPSGELHILGNWTRGQDGANVGAMSFLRSIGRFDLSRIRWLAIQCYRSEPVTTGSIVGRAVYRALSSMQNLHSLTLAQCRNLIFISSLNPDKSLSKVILCPNLQEIILYVKDPGELHVDELLKMAEERASRGAKLSAITIVNTGTLALTRDVFQLRKYVSRVECKFDDAPPEWDTLPVQVM
ncbi:hypothetical protein BJ322DRAFT_1213524 [Thelephora terrestris]|uniref:F-box domain-containing protein n=1 Tax=Thelephora terrestris TaxID=56493 RepID=A0A9P6H7N8_9AGAM|nr:hypothetical protein BJ322DRAFT_1213524 [Thelephora terrestris]